MIEIVRIYYDIQNKTEYEQFLFNFVIRALLEQGEYRLIKNMNMPNQRYLKFMNDKDNEIEVSCRPLIETAIKGYRADLVYIQNTALYKTNSEILNLLPTIFTKEPRIEVFDQNGVIGKWNTN